MKDLGGVVERETGGLDFVSVTTGSDMQLLPVRALQQNNLPIRAQAPHVLPGVHAGDLCESTAEVLWCARDHDSDLEAEHTSPSRASLVASATSTDNRREQISKSFKSLRFSPRHRK